MESYALMHPVNQPWRAQSNRRLNNYAHQSISGHFNQRYVMHDNLQISQMLSKQGFLMFLNINNNKNHMFEHTLQNVNTY